MSTLAKQLTFRLKACQIWIYKQINIVYNSPLKIFVLFISPLALSVLALGILNYRISRYQPDIYNSVETPDIQATISPSAKPEPSKKSETSPTIAQGPATVPQVQEAFTKAGYPVHTGIVATVFWVGEEASGDNGYISNHQSAWDSNWTESYGGIDDPYSRNGWHPAAFTPRENPFYVALPYSDYTTGGRKENINFIPWYTGNAQDGVSLVKNKWVKITHGNTSCYAQWENSGPFYNDDVEYVFGTSRPLNTAGVGAGIDISPAVRDCLGAGPVSMVSWQFINSDEIPAGPWKEIITTSNPRWN